MPRSRATSGFSLLEIMIVITIMSIMAGLIAVNTGTNLRDSLRGTGEVVAAEVAYARSLAVMNNSTYQLSLDATTHRMTLTHLGSNAALNILPWTAFHTPLDTTTAHIVDLTKLPQLGSRVRLHGVLAMASSAQSVTTLAFGPLGETTRTETTVIWLAAGSGTGVRYLSVTVNPVTGLTTLGEFTATAPSGL